MPRMGNGVGYGPLEFKIYLDETWNIKIGDGVVYKGKGDKVILILV